MRIVLLVDRYLPSPLSSAKMFYDLATEMSRLGNDVTVVTGCDSLRTRFEVSKEGNLTVVRVRVGKIRHSSKIVRAINERRLSGIIWKVAGHYFKAHPCSLVVYYSPTIFWSGLVKRLKAQNGCGSYLVLRDLFPQWALDTGLLRRYGLAHWYFRRQEMKLYQSADVIGVQSPANLNYFSSDKLRGRYNLEVLFNWTRIEDRLNTVYGLRARMGLLDKIIFMYGGNLGVAQDIDNLLRLADRLKEEMRIFFLLVGEGSEYSRIEHEVKKRDLNNIKLLPAVSQDEYHEILEECDVGLITLRKDFRTQNFPGKMLSYMALRKPILASINPGNDLSAILHDYDAGFACNNGDDEFFCEYALKLANDESLRLRMGMNAHRLLNEKFNVSSAARQILGHFS